MAVVACLPDFDSCGRLVHMDFGRAQTLIDTLQQASKQGIALEQVLPMLTSNVADLLKMQDKGRVFQGADADLVVFDQSFNVQDLMALGKWHKREGEMLIKGTFE